MAQGTIFTANDAANYLKQANKNYLGQQTWLKAYDDINKAYGGMVTDLSINAQQQDNAALQDFSDSIANAYDASLRQKNQILGSNLGQGFKDALVDENESILNNAYNSYLQNFMNERSNIASNPITNVNGIYQSASKDVAIVDAELNKQASNIADYLNAHFDYLEALYNKDDSIFSSPDFYDYVNYSLVDGTLVPGELKDIQSIRDMMFDANGELNERGENFFKQIESYGIGTDFTFGDYLYNTNKELYDWSISANPYDATYSDIYGINTNRASALGMIMKGNGGVIDTEYVNTDKTIEDLYYANVNKNVYEEENDNLGKLKVYGKGSETVTSPINVTTVGFKDRDNENFHIKFTDSDGKKHSYKLEAVAEKDKDGILTVDTETVNKIDKLVGGIQDGKLYYNNNILYIGVVDKDGKKKLRKVQGQGIDAGNGDYDKLIRSFN